MAEVFENCALGMMSLMIEAEAVIPLVNIGLEAAGRNQESLLVAWLGEILFKVDVEGWALRSFEVNEISNTTVSGWGIGEQLDPERHGAKMEIKAPTHHMFELSEEKGHWTAQVIFDV